MSDRTCSIEGCERLFYAKNMCRTCYCRVWYQERHPRKTTEDRFWEKVDKSGPRGCWVWTAADNGNGYGNFGAAKTSAHRYSYWLATGEKPETVDHICHNTLCVNPKHLRAATRKQNNEHRQRAYGKSGIRGVRWHDGAWEARARHHGRDYSGGRFATIEEAERAAIALRNSLFIHNDLDRRTA